jgi:acetaldehyde dehydrogenase / alcohol dehydrogenase
MRTTHETEVARSLTEQPLAALAPYFQPVGFAAGDCIFKAGSPADGCYVIDRGRVRIELDRSELDSDDVLAVLEPGTILGELSLLDGLPRSASAFAHTDVQARKLSAADVGLIAESDPRLLAELYAALGRNAALKLRHTNERLADAVFGGTDPEVEELVARAAAAQAAVADWPEARVDALLQAMAQAVAAVSGELAEATVRVTRMGNAPDKTVKNLFASMGVYRAISGKPAGGLLRADDETGVAEHAAPVGVVFGLVPVTNPVATAIFKAMIAVKGRNALILSFHRRAQELAPLVCGLIQEVLTRSGAPADLVQWVKGGGSRRKTELFMRHAKVSLVLATGGASMVHAAYSSGTPAIGVGPGNAPVLVCADADIEHAAQSVVLGKSFDNGLICGSENNLVVVEAVREAFAEALVRAGAAVLVPGEARRFAAVVIDPETGHLRAEAVGQSAQAIAGFVGIQRAYPVKAIVVPTEGVGRSNPFAGEKMAPILSLFTVPDEDAGLALCRALLEREGTGHTAIVHTQSRATVDRFAAAMPASRLLVNSPGSHGIMGFTTGLEPSLTLGCGTFGKNSTTDNVTYRHLLNVKRVADFKL